MIVGIVSGGRGSGSRRRTYEASTQGAPEITIADGCMTMGWQGDGTEVYIRMRRDDARLIAAALKLLEVRYGAAN